MNIAASGNEWSKKKFVRYPTLNRHLETSLNKQKMIYKYPQPVEKPLSWKDLK